MIVYDLPTEKPCKANDLSNITVSTLWSQDLPGQASLTAVPELHSSFSIILFHPYNRLT